MESFHDSAARAHAPTVTVRGVLDGRSTRGTHRKSAGLTVVARTQLDREIHGHKERRYGQAAS
jgi:hypothetical protein